MPTLALKLCLDELATQKGLTQKDIHFGTQLSYPTIHRYWRNTAMQVDLAVLGTLCKFLECEPGDLIKRIDGTVSE